MKKLMEILKNETFIRVMMIILGSLFSTLVLTFAILTLIKVQANDYVSASGYLVAIFVVLAFSRLMNLLRERTKTNFVRFVVLFVLDIVLGAVIYFGQDNPLLYPICAGLFCLTVVISRLFKIIENHSLRSIIFNGLIIILATLLGIGLLLPYSGNDHFSPVVIVCFIVAFTAVMEVMASAASQLKLKILFQIIIRTYALEVLLGLLTMIVAASLIFYYYEPNIPSFGDGLWYSFAVVTTIGFGDFAALTIIGRITTVILGIYGILVVAVITSIIVNFYNETAGKRDTKELKDIKDDQNKKKK